MDDDYVGYGSPPKQFQFKKGVSGNRKGRPKRRSLQAHEIISSVFHGVVKYQENGQQKSSTWSELIVRSSVQRALAGDVKSANALLRLRIHADKFSDPDTENIHVTGWLPDHPGQTAEQKAQEQTKHKDGKAPAWWVPRTDPNAKDHP